MYIGFADCLLGSEIVGQKYEKMFAIDWDIAINYSYAAVKETQFKFKAVSNIFDQEVCFWVLLETVVSHFQCFEACNLAMVIDF